MAFDAGAVIGRLELNIAAWQQSVEKVKADQTSLSGLVMRHDQQFKSLGKTLTVVGGAIVASLGAMVKKTADYGDELNDLRQRTGIAVETLSSFKLAADKSGTSIEGFATGMKGLSRVMVEAASGGKEAQGVFKAIGVSATDGAGKIRPLDQVMLDVADRFVAMEDGAVKNELAMKLFGKAGMDLIPMLNLGRVGLEAEMESAKRLGLVMSKETAKACDEFNDSLTELKGGLQGVGIQIGTALMPTVKQLIEKITSVIVKIVAWAKEHPGLSAGLSKVALGLGTLFSAIGPVIYALPGLIKGLETIKLIASKSIVFTFSLAGLAIVSAAIVKMIDDFKKLKEAGASTADALRTQFKDLNPFRDLSREGLGKFLTDMDAARDKSINVKGAIVLLSEAFRAIKGAIEAGGVKKFIPDLEALKKITTELKETWTPNTQGMINLTKGTISARDVIQGFAGTLTTTLIPATRDMELIMKLAQGQFDETGNAASGLERVFNALGQAIGVSAATVVIEMYNIQAAVLGTMGIIIPAITTPWEFLSFGLKDVAKTAKTAMNEVSTVVADAMRDIARSIVEVLNLKELFGIADKTGAETAKAARLMSEYYDGLVKAADSAYDALVATTKTAYSAMEAAANASYDAAVNAANKAYDRQEARIALHQQIEDRQRSWTETFEDRKIARQDEREDRAIQRQYDRDDAKFERQHQKEVDAINNSTMTSAQKEAALAALERKYEHEKDVREMQRQHAADVREMQRQHAADVRQRAREHAELVRDLARQRAKEARELAHEEKLEALELAHEVKLEAMKAAELAKLLGLQNAHQADLDAIRKAEDLARQKQADKEEARQNSLWFKVKGIFATAIEQMLTIWVTNLITPILTSIIDDLLPGIGGIGDKAKDTLGPDGLGKTVSGAATSIGNIFTSLATTIGTILTTLATAIGTVLTTIGTAISTTLVTLATGIATAAHILVAALPDLMLIAAAALAIYAGFLIVKGLVDKIFGKKMETGSMEYWLKLQWELLQNSYNFYIGKLTWMLEKITNAVDEAIKPTLWAISAATQLSKDYLKTCKDNLKTSMGYLKTMASTNYLKNVVGYLRDAAGYLKGIAKDIGNLPGAASGAIFTAPSLVRIAERVPEIIMPLREYREMGRGGQTKQSSVNLIFNIRALDGADVISATRRIIIPELQKFYRHGGQIPPSAIGGT